MSTLSVFLTNFNDSKYLGRCIHAIVNQSREPDEFLIQDDASTDNSAEIISEFAQKHPFIQFIRNEQNMGAIASISKLLKSVSKDYMFSTSADDYVKDNVIEESMDMLEKYPHAGLCTGDIALIDSNGISKGNISLGLSDTPCYLSPEEIAEKLLGNPIFGHCTIYKKSAFMEAGGFLPELKWHSDWFVNMVIAFRYGICYIPRVVTVATDGRPGSYCHEGIKDWQQESDIIVNAVKLLKTEFRDVLPYFIRSAAFSVYHQQAVKALMSRQELWDAETMLLMQLPLFYWCNSVVQTRQQRAMKKTVPAFSDSNPDLPVFLERTLKLVEAAKNREALEYYEKHRNCFPQSPELSQFDNLMGQIKSKLSQ